MNDKRLDGVYITGIKNLDGFYNFLDEKGLLNDPVNMFYILTQGKLEWISATNVRSQWNKVNSETVLYHNFGSSYETLKLLEVNGIAIVSKKESFSPEISRKVGGTADGKAAFENHFSIGF